MQNNTTTLVDKFYKNNNQAIIMHLNIYYIILYLSLFVSSLFISHPVCAWMFRLIVLFFIFKDLLYSTTLNNNEENFADLLVILFVIVFWFYRTRKSYLWIFILIMTVIITSIMYNKSFEKNVYLNAALKISKWGIIICLVFALISSTDVMHKDLDNLSKYIMPAVIIRKIRKSDLKKLFI